MQSVELGSVPIGGGMVATHAWITEGPIVLILATSEGGKEEKSRLDMQKAMFIDPLPGKPTPEGVRVLVARVAKERIAELH